MGGGERFIPFRDQCAELRPLQNMRHQRSQPKHHLDSSRGRRRAKLSEYVNGFFTHIPHAGLRRPIWLLLEVVRTGISPQKHGGTADPKTESPQSYCPIDPDVTMLPLSRTSKAMDMPDQGSYCGPGPNSPFCSMRPRRGRSSARWSRP